MDPVKPMSAGEGVAMPPGSLPFFRRGFWRRFELAELLLICYWCIAAALQLAAAPAIARRDGVPAVVGLLLCDAGMIALITWLAGATTAWPAARRLSTRSALVFLTFYVGFMLLPAYAVLVMGNSFEVELLWFDLQLFGAPLVELLEPWLVAGLTDFTQFCYASHFLLPFILFGLLLADHRLAEARLLGAAVAFAVLTCFAIYVIVPARSPYVMAELRGGSAIAAFDGPIPYATAAAAVIREWLHENELFKHDCFPSGHTQLSLTVLIGSWRYHRRSFPFFIVVVGGLIFATLYLRYHYVIDLVAGALLAWLGWWLIPRWNRYWQDTGDADAYRKAALDLPQESPGHAGRGL